MSNTSPLYKFVSLRSPKDKQTNTSTIKINLPTVFINSLVQINESTSSNADKLQDFNNALQAYIDGTDFIRTKQQFDTVKAAQDSAPSQSALELLYDNIIVRTLTSSTDTRVYKLVVDQLKYVHNLLNSGTGTEEFEIIFPQSLLLTFVDFEPEASTAQGTSSVDVDAIGAKMATLAQLENLLYEAKQEDVIAFESTTSIRVADSTYESITNALHVDSVSVADALIAIDDQLDNFNKLGEYLRDTGGSTRSFSGPGCSAGNNALAHGSEHLQQLKAKVTRAQEDGVVTLENSKVLASDKYAPILDYFNDNALSMGDAEQKIAQELKTQSDDIYALGEGANYQKIGTKWVDTNPYKTALLTATFQSNLIGRFPTPCHLQFPFQIADLRVIEHESVGYLPAEIAHINNTQPGEKNTRVTRRLKKLETTETLIAEEEVFRETDTQSTEKFSLQMKLPKQKCVLAGFPKSTQILTSH